MGIFFSLYKDFVLKIHAKIPKTPFNPHRSQMAKLAITSAEKTLYDQLLASASEDPAVVKSGGLKVTQAKLPSPCPPRSPHSPPSTPTHPTQLTRSVNAIAP